MIDKKQYEKVTNNPFLPSITKYEHTGYAFSEHWHEHTEIHLIVKGKCTLYCGSVPIALEEGDCAILNSGELHHGGGGECVFLCILLSPVFFGNTYIVLDRLIKDPYVAEMTRAFENLVQSTDLPSVLETNGKIQLLLSYLIRNYTLKTIDSILYAGHLAKLDKVNRAVTFINQNYEKKISTAALAKLTYLNESYFCQLFKTLMKQSAMEYLTSVRIEKAEHLLKTTAMSVSEISFYCGFSDTNYFSRIYKKQKKKTPTETRREAAHQTKQ